MSTSATILRFNPSYLMDSLLIRGNQTLPYSVVQGFNPSYLMDSLLIFVPPLLCATLLFVSILLI